MSAAWLAGFCDALAIWGSWEAFKLGGRLRAWRDRHHG